MRKVLFMMLVAALSVLPLAAPYAGLLCAGGRYAAADGRYAVADGPVGVGSVPGMSFPAAVDKTRPFLFGTGNTNADVCCLSGACDDARCSEVSAKSARSRREVGAKATIGSISGSVCGTVGTEAYGVLHGFLPVIDSQELRFETRHGLGEGTKKATSRS